MRGPVDINGLPRTGTTALANMMSLDPQFRCLRGWEQIAAVPAADDSRARPPTRGGCSSPGRTSSSRPSCKAMHLYEVDATMEDTEVARHGVPRAAVHAARCTATTRGGARADLTATYEYHRRVVKLLQSQRPPDLWLFKAPHHKFHLEAIVGRLPRRRASS